MRIIFLGSKMRIKMARQIVDALFPEINPIFIEDNSLVRREEITNRLMHLREEVDGIVFGSVYYLELYQSVIRDYCSYTYFAKDNEELREAMLKMAVQGVDLSRLGIDSYHHSSVKRVMEDLGLDMSQIILYERKTYELSADDPRIILEDQRKKYQEGQISGVITCLAYNYEELRREGIPVAYVFPNHDSIVRTIREIFLDIVSRKGEEKGCLDLIMIFLQPKEELAIYPDGEYLYSCEKLKAAEMIHYFAKLNRATVVTQADNQYTVIISHKRLMESTQHMKIFPLLQVLWNQSNCDFSVGIGCGYEPWDAGLNASLALKKACQMERAGVFLCYNPTNIKGPYEFVDYGHKKHVEHQEKISKIVRETGISEKTLKTLLYYIERQKKTTVTSHELRNSLNMSARAANRLLANLEGCGLASIVGHVHLGNAGRPINVYKIELDLT